MTPRTVLTLPIALAGALILASPVGADTLIDNFDDTDLATAGTRPWGGGASWRNVLNGITGGNDNWKSGFTSRGNKIRSNSDTGVGNNDTYTLGVVSGAIRYNHTTSGADGGGIMFSEAASADRAFQLLGVQMTRDDEAFDATGSQYLRLTAWWDGSSAAAPTPNPIKPETKFVMLLGQTPEEGLAFGVVPINQPAKNVMGPWSSDGSSLDGFPLTATPQVFIVDLKDTDVFKINPDYEALVVDAWNTNPFTLTPTITSLALDDWADLRILQFWAMVDGAPAQTGSHRASFALDDIMLLDEFPGVEYSTSTALVVEGGAGAGIDVNLAAMPSHDVTIDFPDSARLAFAPNSLTFTTANWAAPQTVTISAFENGDVEGTIIEDYDPGVTTSDLWYGGVGNEPGTVQVTILDNDNPTVNFAAASSTVNEGDGTAEIGLVLSDVLASDLPTTFSLTGGDAMAGTDYVAGPLTATFLAGDTVTTLTITLNDNMLDQDARTLEVSIDADASYTLGTPSVHTLTINDNDAEPSISLPSSTVAADESDGTVTLTVTLDAPSGRTVSIDFDTMDGVGADAALAGTNYQAQSGTLTFVPGNVSEDIVITLIDTSVRGGDVKDFTVELSDPVNATLPGGSTTITVQLTVASSVNDWKALGE